VLAPKKFTTTVDSVAVCEDMLAEGMLGMEPTHPDARDITSSTWGSYFFSPDPRVVGRKDSVVLGRASSFRKLPSAAPSPSAELNKVTANREEELKRALSLRRAAASAPSAAALRNAPMSKSVDDASNSPSAEQVTGIALPTVSV